MSWLLLLILASPARPADSALVARIHALIESQAQPAPEVGLVLLPLDGRRAVTIEPDKVFHAASTMKVPVMIELFRQAKAGRLRLDDALPIVNDFHSIVDGSVYHLQVGDDSDAEVYKAVGRTMTLRELCEAMITVSSNLAANLLIERLGVENIRATVARLGATGMNVRRGVEDQKAFDQGLNNTTTAAVLRSAPTRGGASSPAVRRSTSPLPRTGSTAPHPSNTNSAEFNAGHRVQPNAGGAPTRDARHDAPVRLKALQAINANRSATPVAMLIAIASRDHRSPIRARIHSRPATAMATKAASSSEVADFTKGARSAGTSASAT